MAFQGPPAQGSSQVLPTRASPDIQVEPAQQQSKQPPIVHHLYGALPGKTAAQKVVRPPLQQSNGIQAGPWSLSSGQVSV